MYDLIIIGGGPAGLTASVYAARKRLNTLLVSGDIGGQINMTLGVENYMGYHFIEGTELIEKFYSQMSQFPIDQKVGYKVSRLEQSNKGFQITTENGESYQSRAAILATGKVPRRLNIPGETELTGRGVSYCATCDGPVFAGQPVAVIGGGNSALQAVLDMLKIAEHVYLVSLSRLTADPILVEKLKGAKNLTVYTEYQTQEIRGENSVKGVVIKDLKTGGQKQLDVAGIFIEIGLIPASDLVKGLMELNKLGEVPVNCSCETAVPGLYAAGDVTDVVEKQIVIAAGEGAKAALQADKYLQRLAK